MGKENETARERVSLLEAARLPVSYGRIPFITLAVLSVAFTSVFYIPSAFNGLEEPEDSWSDNVWPIRQSEPWDISTGFHYPRKLEFDVTEGTWLRLDVHPKNGDIIFDMLGDLYCLPASEHSSSDFINARPVLVGVPYDTDPHFSPDGTKVAYRSDAGLGVENIWVIPWTDCQGVSLASMQGSTRLVKEGRDKAQRVTNETYRWVSDPRFHPSGSHIIATKWYFTTRSLGAGEGWSYSVPDFGNETHIGIESGSRLVGRDLPRGYTTEDYAEQQIGPEQFIYRGNDSLIYAKNVVDERSFEYSKDVHSGIYAIFSKNLTTGVTETLVSSSPGGASRPELSRDGRTLAFVRRVRDKEALVLKDLETGTLRNIWYGLTYDATSISAPMGTYPSFSFAPDDSSIVIWAAGHIHRIPLESNSEGERVGSTTSQPTIIPFKAHISLDIAETRKNEGDSAMDLIGLETADNERVTAFKDLRVNRNGSAVVFQAGGRTFVQRIDDDSPATAIPVVSNDEGVTPYYSPSFVQSSKTDLVIQSRWSDTSFTKFEVADLSSGKAYEVQGLGLGRYVSPAAISSSDGLTIAWIKLPGDTLTGDLVATARPGLYIGVLDAETFSLGTARFVPSDISIGDSSVQLSFIEDGDAGKLLLVQQSDIAFVVDLAGEPDKTGRPPHSTLARGAMSAEISVHPSFESDSVIRSLYQKAELVAEKVAFVDFFHIYFALGSNIAKDESVWSKPGNATKGLARLSLDGGHDVVFSGDGSKVFWLLGPYLHWLEVSKLDKCKSAIADDPIFFGIDCVKNLLDYEEIVIEHSTDVSRLKKEASEAGVADFYAFVNANILTMTGESAETDLIRGGVVTVRGGIIESVGSFEEVMPLLPEGATIMDVQGGFVVPGFIDMHAHWEGFTNSVPAKSWELEAFLAYGVTTLHNPSADNVLGFVERSRVERGQLVGPRIFQTGTVIYGASEAQFHQDVVNMDDAHQVLTRIRAEGGSFTTSYKNYNIPSRGARQRLLTAAKNLSMLCVPEGGMNLDWDLTYIIDGMTTIEHNIPVPVLYDDILTLYVKSGTGATPTHIVDYGGVFGEQYVWANNDLPNDEKLRRFVPHGSLELITESTARPRNSYAVFNTSESIAKMVNMGLRAHIGAHGEPPKGFLYHSEMEFASLGGLSNYQVLQAATSSGAKTLGLQKSIGSIAPGLLADLVVYPAGVDILNGDISKTRELKLVVRGGRIWNANTMEQVWPTHKERQVMPPLNL